MCLLGIKFVQFICNSFPLLPVLDEEVSVDLKKALAPLETHLQSFYDTPSEASLVAFLVQIAKQQYDMNSRSRDLLNLPSAFLSLFVFKDGLAKEKVELRARNLSQEANNMKNFIRLMILYRELKQKEMESLLKYRFISLDGGVNLTCLGKKVTVDGENSFLTFFRHV